MATVIVHDVDKAALARLRASLAHVGSSVEAEVRSMIEERGNTADAERLHHAEAAMKGLREHRSRMQEKYGSSINLTEMLLQERAEV